MVTNARPFRSARLKIQRANRHIDELQTAITELSSPGFYGIDVHSQDDGINVAVMSPRQPVPDSLPLIIGDAIHNLKSAFDHAFAEAAKGRLREADLMFPFYKKREDLVSSTRINAIELSIPGAREVIIDKIQPHENGQMSLYGLHLLDRIDKHNELIVTTHGAILGSLVLLIDGGRYELVRCTFNAEKPTTLFRGPGEIAVESDFKTTFEVRFDKALPFGNEPVLPTLIQLSDAASEAIELLTALI